MKKYILSTSKNLHGQPIRLFKANLENNTSKAIDQLSGICSGILADGEVNDAEARFFADYVRKFAACEPVWPLTDILERVNRIFSDGHCDEDERVELKAVMEELCGHFNHADPSETYSTTLPLDNPLPNSIIFSERNFVITGRFAFGTRSKVEEAISKLGGVPTSSAPTGKTHYLVIGLFASRDWANTNYGRKIERARELRDEIASEIWWVAVPLKLCLQGA